MDNLIKDKIAMESLRYLNILLYYINILILYCTVLVSFLQKTLITFSLHFDLSQSRDYTYFSELNTCQVVKRETPSI